MPQLFRAFRKLCQKTAGHARIRPEKGPIVILFRLFYNESVTDISSLLTETAFT